MAQRANRARSADRAEPQEMMFGQLLDVLRDMRLNQREVRREQFKPPQYNGEGDVELFIQQFNEVAAANEWNAVSTLLHLRESLQEGAREYGRAATVEAVLAALRSRYGLSQREARHRLNGLKKDAKHTLHDHAIAVEKLVRKAFEELPEATQTAMMLDSFCSTLGDAALQRHLLAVQPATITEAIQHGQEFLDVKPQRTSTDSNKVRVMEEGEDEEEGALAKLMKAIQVLSAKVEGLQSKAPTTSKSAKCWGCQKEGHVRSKCPTNPWTKKQAGNDDSPQ